MNGSFSSKDVRVPLYIRMMRY